MPKILVGVDSSDRGKDALALAAQLGRASQAELVLAAAYPYDDFPRSANATYRRALREEAEAGMKDALDAVGDLPDAAMRTIADVSPARGMHTLAVREGASLIVIGSSHRGAAGRVFAGTTAERLLHGAPCPVVVAPAGFREREPAAIETIAVAYDRSDEAQAALATAVAAARALGARLRVIEVLDMLWVGTPALMAGPGYIRMPHEIEEHARQTLTERIAGLPEEVHAEAEVVVGDPVGELVGRSADADLMIAGSRAYGPHRAVLVGSVSGRLVREAACPVLVVPRGVAAPLDDVFPAHSGTQAA